MPSARQPNASPSLKNFAALAKTYALVPVTRTVTADLETPVSAFLRVAAEEPEAFLLESVEGGEHVGRYTFIGIRPYRRITARGRNITVAEGRKRRSFQGDIFAELKSALEDISIARLPGLPPFTAGAVGFFSYDVVRQIETLPTLAADELHAPDAHLMFFDEVLAFDHVKKAIHLIVTAGARQPITTASYADCTRRLDRLERLLQAAIPAQRKPKKPAGPLKLKPRTKPAQFLKSVDAVKEYVRAGDIFQCVLSQRFDCTPSVDPFSIYRSLRIINPSPFMYFLRFNDAAKPSPQHIVGSSPELLVRVKTIGDTRRVEYRPIAGSRPRGVDEASDRALEADLRTDSKEVAEHIMLVDLGRNDVGRVSEFGTVKVNDLMFVERYSHIMHLVSALEGTLKAGLSPLDAFRACFPAGTLSGAPQNPRHGNHRRARTCSPRRLRRRHRLRRLLRQLRLLHRHPHPLHGRPRRPHPIRRRHRRRLRPRKGTRRVPQQGRRRSPSHRTRPPDVTPVCHRTETRLPEASPKNPRISPRAATMLLATMSTSRRALTPVLAFVAAVLLLWPALANHYPLLFPDTLDYLQQGRPVLNALLHANHAPFHGMRSAIYALAIYPFHLNRTPWPILLVHAAVVSYLVYLTTRSVVPRNALRNTAFILAALGALTGISWYIVLLMPDILGGPLYLALYLLTFARPTLSRPEQGIVAALAILCATSHSTHLFLAIFLVTLFWLLKPALRILHRESFNPLPATAVVLAAILLQLAVNARLYGHASLERQPPPRTSKPACSPTAPPRSTSSSTAPTPPSPRSAPTSTIFPANDDDFLWSDTGIWSTASDTEQRELLHEERPLALAILRTHPYQQLKLSLANFGHQLLGFGLDDFDNNDYMQANLNAALANARRAYDRSLQARDATPWHIATILQNITVIAALLLLALIRPGTSRLRALTATILIVTVANAFLTGVFSEVDARYQARIVWLIPFAAALCLLHALTTRRTAIRNAAHPA